MEVGRYTYLVHLFAFSAHLEELVRELGATPIRCTYLHSQHILRSSYASWELHLLGAPIQCTYLQSQHICRDSD
jgi:hypothetical protein